MLVYITGKSGEIPVYTGQINSHTLFTDPPAIGEKIHFGSNYIIVINLVNEDNSI